MRFSPFRDDRTSLFYCASVVPEGTLDFPFAETHALKRWAIFRGNPTLNTYDAGGVFGIRETIIALEHFVPFRLVFQHDLAEESNREHSVIEQFVVEFFQGEIFALLHV